MHAAIMHKIFFCSPENVSQAADVQILAVPTAKRPFV